MQHTENERTVFNLNPKAFRGGDPGEVTPAGTFHDQAPATSQGDSEGGE